MCSNLIQLLQKSCNSENFEQNLTFAASVHTPMSNTGINDERRKWPFNGIVELLQKNSIPGPNRSNN
ncbi:hypothetical protein BpHYR1_048334 [Brachionus plicatilis]|uniref:Uncharacterized protein n=1 Tax=Brachionus plicatilis TaxID=10195 RepID=A0A3M7PDW1_BRAPC|nr:hypothetical protein BpHYR1_048334 [Brachionus plicatilis]